MPAPSNPPYAAGALAIPRQLNKWLDVNPVRPLGRIRGYFQLPAFTATQPRGTGYANIVAVFNYTSDRNFSIKSISSLATSYVLCVMWVDQYGTVHRYALWPNVAQLFYFQLVPYTNQLIGKNFRLEVWNGDYVHQLYQNFLTTEDGVPLGTEGGDFLVSEQQYYSPEDSAAVPVVQTSPITFYTSLLGEYDYMWQDDFVSATTTGIVTDLYVPLSFTFPIVFPTPSVPVPTTI